MLCGKCQVSSTSTLSIWIEFSHSGTIIINHYITILNQSTIVWVTEVFSHRDKMINRCRPSSKCSSLHTTECIIIKCIRYLIHKIQSIIKFTIINTSRFIYPKSNICHSGRTSKNRWSISTYVTSCYITVATCTISISVIETACSIVTCRRVLVSCSY